MLRIMIAEDNRDTRESLVMLLSPHFRITRTTDSARDVENCPEDVDLILLDVHLRDGNGLEAFERLQARRIVPAVVVTGDRDTRVLERAVRDHVMGFLLKPYTPDNARAMITVTWNTYQTICELTGEVGRLREAIEARKLVDRAKGVLMDRHGWSEPVAFRTMQKRAMDTRVSMAEVARRVIEGRAM